MAGFYSFLKGVPGKLGVGTADEGLLRSQSLPINSQYGPTYNVQRCFAPTQAKQFLFNPSVPTVSSLGLTGLFQHGVPLLGRLASKSKG